MTRAYIFSVGLDHHINYISSLILAAYPLPSLEEAYSQLTMKIENQLEVSTLVVQITTIGQQLLHVLLSLSLVSALIGTKHHIRDSAQDSSTNNPHPDLHVTRVSPEKGNFGFAFIFASTNTWVIDSLSIGHMISYFSLIDSLIPSHVKSVQIANGTPMSIS